MQSKIAELQRMVDESENIVFFGGAGVSTASGIPDFRSKDGLYNNKDVKFEKYQAEWLLSHDCLYQKPNVFFEFYRQKMDTRNIKPNITHYKLAELEKSGKLKAIVTQNIDGLHQRAGSKKVFEIHGTTQKCYCHKCKKEYPYDYIFESTDDIPRCDCVQRGIIRPDVVLYQESLPNKVVKEALNAIREADMLIVAGTSLIVQPAASFVSEFCGDKLVLINKGDVYMDLHEDLCINHDMTEIFDKIRV